MAASMRSGLPFSAQKLFLICNHPYRFSLSRGLFSQILCIDVHIRRTNLACIGSFWNIEEKKRTFASDFGSGLTLQFTAGNSYRCTSLDSAVSPTSVFTSFRKLCSTKRLSDEEIKREVEDISDHFAEAREMLEDARNSYGTVYFNEDMEEAEELVSKTLEKYNNLLLILSEEQKDQVVRSIGLKMQELRAQQDMILEMIKDD